MDWAWVYGTLFRTAGWSWKKCRRQPASVVFAYLEHLAAYPPEYMILAAVHLKQTPKPMHAEMSDLREILPVMGGTQSVPEHIHQMVAWAEGFGKPVVN